MYARVHIDFGGIIMSSRTYLISQARRMVLRFGRIPILGPWTLIAFKRVHTVALRTEIKISALRNESEQRSQAISLRSEVDEFMRSTHSGLRKIPSNDD